MAQTRGQCPASYVLNTVECLERMQIRREMLLKYVWIMIWSFQKARIVVKGAEIYLQIVSWVHNLLAWIPDGYHMVCSISSIGNYRLPSIGSA